MREVFVPCSRAPSSSFEGAARRPYGSRRHSVTELTPVLPHSTVQWRGWPHRTGVWWNSAGVGFLGGVRGPAWRGFVLDPGVRSVPEHLMLWSGEWVWRHGPVVVDPHWPRARRSFARGGIQPSSEAESHTTVRVALERGGVSYKGARGPRARRGPARGGVGASCLLGHWRYPGRGCVRCNWPLVSSFMLFCYFAKYWVFPGLLGDPYGCPRQEPIATRYRRWNPDPAIRWVLMAGYAVKTKVKMLEN
jgi:hypothetical protein